MRGWTHNGEGYLNKIRKNHFGGSVEAVERCAQPSPEFHRWDRKVPRGTLLPCSPRPRAIPGHAGMEVTNFSGRIDLFEPLFPHC